ncbi:hypothetical protein GpartN1_g6792.t1 [Galdieria partita]|uniref:CUE domain-containing protein n=1 Tax=Galdieria partita TaxID=83374 RepID=A0A9C7Q441_9RHOD|nr:hypothetical protein GpartN1_g6792.t1 [Galdieria partita]
MDQTKQKKDIVEQIMEICSVFEEEAKDALAACNNDLELAIERILSGKEYSWQKVSKRGRCFKSSTTKQLNTRHFDPKEQAKFTKKRSSKEGILEQKPQEGRKIGYSRILNDETKVDESTEQQHVQLKEDDDDRSFPRSSNYRQVRSMKTRWKKKEKLADKVNSSDKYVDWGTDDGNRNSLSKDIIHLLDSPSFHRNGMHRIEKSTMKEESYGSEELYETSSNSHMQQSMRDEYSMKSKNRLHFSSFEDKHFKPTTEVSLVNSTQKWEPIEDSRELRIRFGSLTLSSSIRCVTHEEENEVNRLQPVHFQSNKMKGLLRKSKNPVQTSLNQDFHVDSWNKVEGAQVPKDVDDNLVTNTTEQYITEYPFTSYNCPNSKFHGEVLNVSDFPKGDQTMQTDGAIMGTAYNESQMAKETHQRQNTSCNGIISSSSSSWTFHSSRLPPITKNRLEISDRVPVSLLSLDTERTHLQPFHYPRAPLVSNETSFGFHMPTFQEKASFSKQDNIRRSFQVSMDSNFMSQQSYPLDGALWKEMQRYPLEQPTMDRLSPVQSLHHHHLPLRTKPYMERYWK